MSSTTIGIIIAIVVVAAILVYIFKDKIFKNKQGGGPSMTPPSAPPAGPDGPTI